MYPEFVRELQEEADAKVDLRDQGTIFLFAAHSGKNGDSLPAPLAELEPALAEPPPGAAYLYLKERSVNPRALSAAAFKAAKHRGVDVASGTTVTVLLGSSFTENRS